MKTAQGLVELAKLAYNENWGFCLGAYGQILTKDVFNALINLPGHTGEYNKNNQNYIKKFIGNRVSDCYGIVKAYLWWNNGNVKYNKAQDRNQSMAYRDAKEKGTLNTLPEIPGIILCSEGHAGVYIGEGEFIECSGIPVGMRKGRIRNNIITYGSNFKYWFKDTYIKY